MNDKKQFDMIFADLGVSSVHFDKGERGFSLKKSGPLDMRMDKTQSLTAEQIVNNWEANEIELILKEYGQEHKANKIAKKICKNRPITDTVQLAELVHSVYGGKRKKTDPATKTFQALRVAVNDELNQLKLALPIWLQLLKPEGRIAIISFHSLEDKIVKRFFKSKSMYKYDKVLSTINKSPIKASRNEIVLNPRARSAKLRAAVKIKTKEGAF